jgi:hypothetical protein
MNNYKRSTGSVTSLLTCPHNVNMFQILNLNWLGRQSAIKCCSAPLQILHRREHGRIKQVETRVCNNQLDAVFILGLLN